MAYRKDIRRTQSSFAIGKTTENATSLKIISDDLCDRNCLKSKVSTIEELYDFCRHFVDRLNGQFFTAIYLHKYFSNQLCRRQPQPSFSRRSFERQFRRKTYIGANFPHGLLLCDKECLQGQYLRATHFRQVG